MTSKSRHQFESTVRGGEARSRRYYIRVIEQVLSGCSKDDDFTGLYPFNDESRSGLAYALWRLSVAYFLGEIDTPPYLIRKCHTTKVKSDPISQEKVRKIKYFMVDNNLTAKQLAKDVGMSNSTLHYILKEKYCGPSGDRVYNYVTSKQ